MRSGESETDFVSRNFRRYLHSNRFFTVLAKDVRTRLLEMHVQLELKYIIRGRVEIIITRLSHESNFATSLSGFLFYFRTTNVGRIVYCEVAVNPLIISTTKGVLTRASFFKSIIFSGPISKQNASIGIHLFD